MEYYQGRGAGSFVLRIYDKIEDVVALLRKWPDIGFIFHVIGERIYRKARISKNVVMIYRNDGSDIRILHFLDLRNQPVTDEFVEGL